MDDSNGWRPANRSDGLSVADASSPTKLFYVPDQDAYVMQCDWTTVAPSMVVVELVADLTDRSVDSVSGLHTTVDPESFDAIVTRSGKADDTRIEFTHDGIRFAVYGDGSVVARVER